MKTAEEQCIDLATEVLRLAECARSFAAIAKVDPDQYVDAVERHFLALLVPIADLRKSLAAK